MSYHHRSRARRAHAMGGLVTDILTANPVSIISSQFTSIDEDACVAKRKQAQVKIDADIAQMQRDWKPTGYYRAADMMAMRDQTVKLLVKASADLENAASGDFTYKATLSEAQGKVQTRIRDSLPFTSAINMAAQNHIDVIDAPSFRRWVMDSMTMLSVAYGHIAYMTCLKPFIVVALEMAYSAVKIAGQIVKTMVKVVIAAGEQFIRVVDSLDTIWTITKWGSLAAGLLWLGMKVKKKPAP